MLESMNILPFISTKEGSDQISSVDRVSLLSSGMSSVI